MNNTIKKKKSLAETIERIILIIGFGILIGSFILPAEFRNALAEGVNFIVSPITSTMPFYICVLVIALIVTVTSTFIQKYTMDWGLYRRVMEKNQIFQKEYKEAQVSGNKTRLKKLEEERMSMMDDQSAMTKEQLKPMGFIVIISIPLFWWAYWFLSTPGAPVTMNFPLLGTVNLNDVLIIFPYWIVWSILCSLAISFVVRKAFSVGV
jgi:uncharacterized membrane protein (DUF106 family)